ncbi:ATP12 chaperone protein [Necator americanus]|uniref:ATP12 chaperone protein n=1 Tax=Necator americanus TaxID=51031 RepID=W2SGQ7_NECAM|nr:ATP12 chaperone protein [Necator americanus]ETN68733.1 ATP12 chaperone protein [Necator americanus]
MLSKRLGSKRPGGVGQAEAVEVVVDVVAEERQGKNLYKVTLDGRMLKTQAGNVLQIESEPLALAIAEEWASQDQHLQMGHMRLTDSEVISAKDSRIVEKWLMSHNFWALTGLQYAVESLKSVLLPYSMVTFKLQAEEAVHHAMLEQKTQSETWGSVEWAHGMEEEELKTRVAASVLFVYFNSNAVTKRTP